MFLNLSTHASKKNKKTEWCQRMFFFWQRDKAAVCTVCLSLHQHGQRGASARTHSLHASRFIKTTTFAHSDFPNAKEAPWSCSFITSAQRVGLRLPLIWVFWGHGSLSLSDTATDRLSTKVEAKLEGMCYCHTFPLLCRSRAKFYLPRHFFFHLLSVDWRCSEDYTKQDQDNVRSREFLDRDKTKTA